MAKSVPPIVIHTGARPFVTVGAVVKATRLRPSVPRPVPVTLSTPPAERASESKVSVAVWPVAAWLVVMVESVVTPSVRPPTVSE